MIFSILLISSTVGTAYACTSFCMDTPGGPVFGANLDLFIPGDGHLFVNQRGIAKQGYDASTTGETAEWVSRYGSVSFNLAGREFAFGGMNEAGLVISSMELRAGEYPEPDERPPLGNGTWVQYMLDNCADVQAVIEAGERTRVQDHAPPSHYLVADATGDCLGVEWLDGRVVFFTGESLPVRAMSNMRYERALAALERGGPRWWWSNPGRSAERFAAAAARNEGFAATPGADAVSYAFETLTRMVAAPHTKWNIVFDIARREIWFRSAVSPAVKHLSLHAFDFSCDAPLLMLDVNAPLAGNVERSFEPYDPGVNSITFRTLCERYDIDVSAEDAAGLMRLFEGFQCAQ